MGTKQSSTSGKSTNGKSWIVYYLNEVLLHVEKLPIFDIE